jgi:signal transduction histidine kinase/CheY-like chemotaxis protein/HPt (histidine-containing phosphotransfer) domain-containing protein
MLAAWQSATDRPKPLEEWTNRPSYMLKHMFGSSHPLIDLAISIPNAEIRSALPASAIAAGAVFTIAGIGIGWIARHLLARNKKPSTAATSADAGHIALVSQIPCPALLSDSHGKILSTNPAADSFLEIRRIPAEKALPAELIATMQCLGDDVTSGSIYTRPAGDYWIGWVLAQLSPEAILALPIDLTEMKRQETRIQHERDEALGVAKSSSELVATISHDIRVPMNGVLGMGNLLLETSLNAQQYDMARALVASAENVITVADGLLDHAKLKAGKLEIRTKDFDLGQVLEELLKGHSARAAEKKLDLYCQIDHKLPALINSDPIRLRQILGNLLSNALKFTDHGEVFVAVGTDISSTPANTPLLKFSVHDTGIGIARENRERLFHAFSQADSNTSAVYGGTGLGLAISQHLAGMLGGQLSFESEPGRGSIFNLTIPLVAAADPRPQTWTQRNPSVDGIDILIVEDHPQIALLLKDWIQRAGGKPVVLADTSEIPQWISAGGRCSVALVDLDMPLSPNPEDILILRQQQPSPRIIGLGARPPEGRTALDLDDIILKPILPVPLLNRIGRQPQPSQMPPDKMESAPSPQSAKATATSRPKVVVADDDIINQKVMRSYLERIGCDVRAASSGVEALAIVAKGACDILFLDIMMPRMDGLQTIRELRRLEKEQRSVSLGRRNLPVVAITAKIMPGDREAGLNAGFDEYITKPITEQALRAAVQRFSGKPGSAPQVTTVNTSAASKQVPLIEPSRINELSSGNATAAREIIDLFFQRMDQIVPEIERALASGDLEVARRNAHTGAGSAVTCGMMQTQLTMRRIEQAIGAQPVEAIAGMLEEARRVVASSRACAADLFHQ